VGAPPLTTGEWAVLGLLATQNQHGFGLAKALAPSAEWGQIWTLPKPLVYRALGELDRLQLVVQVGPQAGNRGPTRIVYTTTDLGRSRFEIWLKEPVLHLREVRSQLMLKLAFHQRLELDPRELLHRQIEVLGPLVEGLRRRTRLTSGFDATLALWRYQSALSAQRFVRRLLALISPNSRPR